MSYCKFTKIVSFEKSESISQNRLGFQRIFQNILQMVGLKKILLFLIGSQSLSPTEHIFLTESLMNFLIVVFQSGTSEGLIWRSGARITTCTIDSDRWYIFQEVLLKMDSNTNN